VLEISKDGAICIHYRLFYTERLYMLQQIKFQAWLMENQEK
jgi:hypothetical protein